MRKTTVMVLMSVLAVLISGLGVTFATWSAQGHSVNEVSIASVRGRIVEDYKLPDAVFPGSSVKKIVNVKNTGTVDMVVRVKVDTFWSEPVAKTVAVGNNSALSTDNIKIDYDTVNWLLDADSGYFYYKGVLEPGETTAHPLFSEFHIDGDSENEYAHMQGNIKIDMECIQAGGDGISAWGKTFNDLDVSYQQEEVIPVIVGVAFENPEKGFTFDADNTDLFANFKNLQPGETCSQSIWVENHYQDGTEIFLRAEETTQRNSTPETASLINELLNRYITIQINDDAGKLLYSGPVYGEVTSDKSQPDSMKNNISLGTYVSNERKNLQVQLYVDPEVDNQFRELIGQVGWVFSSSGNDTAIEPPKTGDSYQAVFLWLGMTAVSFTMLYIAVKAKKQKKS